MIVFVGTYCFGLVLGWLTAYSIHHGLLGWREVKGALGVLFGAALQAIFCGITGTMLYGAGVVIGAAFYGATLLVKPLRHAHDISSK
jgi:hypothetical protein